MKDPLTKEQKKKWLKQVTARFNAVYEKALMCGALNEEEVRKAPYILPMCVLVITADKYRPLNERGREVLANLEKFV